MTDAVLRDPESVLDQLCRAGSGSAAIRYRLSQYWLPDSPDLELTCAFVVAERGRRILALATDRDGTDPLFAGLDTLTPAGAEARLRSLAATLETPVLELTRPLTLVPVRIPKPWGQEIWFTGIEARGQSSVSDGIWSAPLPWVLSMAPRRLVAGAERTLNLLKILDPLPEPQFGELYFELHEEKREVYVVTHVDSSAWPGGVGAIRFGFDQALRKSYASDTAFRDAYLQAVTAYECVRRRIDERVDRLSGAAGAGKSATPDPVARKAWLAAAGAADSALEQSLRSEMYRFTNLQPVRVGDVVTVPCLTPHALQHGVRTVEFQTPVYERRILSFTQKVLTQGHWDTAAAVALMNLDPPRSQPVVPLAVAPGVRSEPIAQFSDFDVHRLCLEPGAHWRWEPGGAYALAMVVTGMVDIEGSVRGAEAAVLAPAHCRAVSVRNAGDHEAIVLVSTPAGAV